MLDVCYVGGLNELDKLPYRRTKDFRLDDCPPREVVHELEEPWEREKRIEQLAKRERTK